jgi:hypothetical protein
MDSAHLRRIINSTIADLGHKTKECKEGVLIREGYVVSRQFPSEGVRAIWLAEDAYVARHDGDDGQRLH